MLATWKLLVDRDCGSKNKAGVDAVGQDVKGILESAGFKVRFYEYPARRGTFSSRSAVTRRSRLSL